MTSSPEAAFGLFSLNLAPASVARPLAVARRFGALARRLMSTSSNPHGREPEEGTIIGCEPVAANADGSRRRLRKLGTPPGIAMPAATGSSPRLTVSSDTVEFGGYVPGVIGRSAIAASRTQGNVPTRSPGH